MSEELDNLKSMSLGDHLEELRARLIMIILGVFVGLVVCLCFGKFFVRLLETPYINAMDKIQLELQEPAEEEEGAATPRWIQVKQFFGSLFTQSSEPKHPSADPEAQEAISKADVPIVDESTAEPTEPLTETEQIKATLDQLRAEFEELKAELLRVSSATPLTTMAPAEGFKIYIKVCLVFGLLFASPWVIWQIWAFVSSGLYKKEKQFAHTIAPASTILFIAGALFFMFVVAPLIMEFFVNFDKMLGVVSRWTLLNYVNLVLTMILIFGISFQMPIVIIFAEKVGLVKIEQLTSGRKYVILGIVIAAAITTPPDVISQISLAVPLYILYEGSILVCRFMKMRRQAKPE
jgi:sec-independent protein translocase protein TatC